MSLRRSSRGAQGVRRDRSLLTPPATRSEQIRRRRSTPGLQSADFLKTVRRSRKNLAETGGPPPVMARRGPQAGVYAGRTRRVGARRRFDVPLGYPGAEIRLPSLPRISLGWRFISLPLLAFLVFLLYQFWNLPSFRVGAAQVSGLVRLTSSQVNQVLALPGEPIFTLDAHEMRQELLEAFPEFSQASVQVLMPNSVVITVTERIPVLLWKQDGNTKLVDAEGMTFPLREGMVAPELPTVEASGDPPSVASTEVITGVIPGVNATTGLLELQSLAKELPFLLPVVNQGAGKATRLLTPEMVAAILVMHQSAPNGALVVYQPDRGLGWRDRRGWEVYFGDDRDMPAKLLIYQAILEELKAREIRPALISVQYVHAPYFRVEP